MQNSNKKPTDIPSSPYFCIGSTRKYKGFENSVKSPWLGRSHRALDTVEYFHKIHLETKSFLQIPKDYHIYLINGGATVAVETAIWNFLGSKPIHIPVWDYFGSLWAKIVEKTLALSPVFIHESNHRVLPSIPFNDHDDYLINFGGSTSGLKFTHYDSIPTKRTGLIIADLTSIVGSDLVDWEKIDVGCFSFQKSLTAEGGVGAIVLSPHAYEYLHKNPHLRPVPKTFSLRDIIDMPDGSVLNTPSMLVLEDVRLALHSFQSFATDELTALEGAVKKAEHNVEAIEQVIHNHDFIEFNALHKKDRLFGITALRLLNPEGHILNRAHVQQITNQLHDQRIAFDILGHKFEEHVSIRIATNAHIPTKDIESLLQWIMYEYHQIFHY